MDETLLGAVDIQRWSEHWGWWEHWDIIKIPKNPNQLRQQSEMAQLYFYYSAMNAGKSTSLLQSAHNYREQGMEVLLFTAAIDDRYGRGKISSRIGLIEDAHTFDNNTNFMDFFEPGSESGAEPVKTPQKFACVLVDEAQFLNRQQVEELASIVDNYDIPVLCYGIRTDFMGELFEGSMRLLALADKLKELKTVCSCGKKATMVLRLDAHGQPSKAGDQVEIGGNDRYVSKCRKHYYATVTAHKNAPVSTR